MSDLKPPRGTHDILPEAHRRHRHITETACAIVGLYGYAEMATPIFESAEVFTRTLGETSDVVTKEMYAFEDKKGRRLALRPEGTAGVARAFITHLRSQPMPLKFFYQGPMFRYERAQKGRQRQFHQFGVELLGVPEPLGDVEIITMAAHVLDALGVADRVTLQINTLGDASSRQAYRDVLVGYLKGHRGGLSKDSQDRLDRNPLRIFDSKDPDDQEILVDAPKLADHLNQASQDFFDTVCNGLDAAGVAYTLNSGLVRGLDYYSHTAFEFVTDTLGAQGTVLAGGRYDGLIETMGGPRTPGIGWAAGIERLAMMIGDPPAATRPIAVIPVNADAGAEALILALQLRRAGFSIDLGYSGNLKKRLNRADKANALAAVLMGEENLGNGVVTVRDMGTGEQTEIGLSALEDHLARYR